MDPRREAAHALAQLSPAARDEAIRLAMLPEAAQPDFARKTGWSKAALDFYLRRLTSAAIKNDHLEWGKRTLQAWTMGTPLSKQMWYRTNVQDLGGKLKNNQPTRELLPEEQVLAYAILKDVTSDKKTAWAVYQHWRAQKWWNAEKCIRMDTEANDDDDEMFVDNPENTNQGKKRPRTGPAPANLASFPVSAPLPAASPQRTTGFQLPASAMQGSPAPRAQPANAFQPPAAPAQDLPALAPRPAVVQSPAQPALAKAFPVPFEPIPGGERRFAFREDIPLVNGQPAMESQEVTTPIHRAFGGLQIPPMWADSFTLQGITWQEVFTFLADHTPWSMHWEVATIYKYMVKYSRPVQPGQLEAAFLSPEWARAYEQWQQASLPPEGSEILQANVELSKLAQEYFHRIYTVGTDGSCCRRPNLILRDAVFGFPNLRRHADYQDFLRKFGPITLDDDESLAIELFKRLNQP